MRPHSFERQCEAALIALKVEGPVLVAVSGGSDSMALLRALVTLRASLPIEPHVAHLDHQLRAESAEDARWLRDWCAARDVPLSIELADVAGRARDCVQGLEETARTARYEFLTRTAITKGCAYVLVAHTADDQAETVLHQVLRGSGLAGLSGIPERRTLAPGVELVRPLLGIRRGDLRDYLVATGQAFRNDASNADETFRRNWVRHTLIPKLESDINPQVVEALLKVSAQARDVQAAVAAAADLILEKSLMQSSDQLCELDISPLWGLPRHLLREVFVAIWRRNSWPRQRMSFDHWNRLVELVHSVNQRFDFPDAMCAQSSAGRLRIFRTQTDVPPQLA